MRLVKPDIPKWSIYALLILVPLSWVPLALIAYYRTMAHREPRIHLFRGMGDQAKLKAQALDLTFADHRAMRPPIDGTLARGQLHDKDHLELGKVTVDGQTRWASGYPESITVDEAFIRRGRGRYNIYCAPCHGLDGYGQGMVHDRALRLEVTTWVQPTSFHTDDLRGRPLGDLYGAIKWGRRTMPAYGAQIPTEDRWAIVAYVKALQWSQHADVDDVPEDKRPSLRQE